MKLAAVNPRLDSNIEDFFGKESIGITDLKARLEKVMEAKENAMNQSQIPKIQKVIFLLREPVDDFRKYYEPKVVSLGPIHHGNPKYQLGENYKLLLTCEFIKGSGKNMEDVYNMIKEKIYELRTCFEEEVIEKYDDEALTSILLVDGCAILQYIYCATNNKFKELKIETDSVAFGQRDLFLLENQLPYRLLTWLMSLSVKEKELRESIETYIGSHVKVPEDQQSNWLSWRLSQRSKPQQAQSAKEESHDEKNPHVQDHTTSVAQAPEPVHLLDHLRTRMLHGPEYIPDGTVGKINQNIQNVQEHWQSYRNVQELKTAGIHLKRGNDCYLSKIKFTKQFIFRGQLHLPPIVVDDSTRPKFLNLIAYEMCLDFKNDFGVTSYISFLDSLIDEANDVKMLRKARILHNVLGSDEEVAKLFNEIGTSLVPNVEIYKDVRSEIQKHYESKWMTWIAQVFHDHFSSPWTFIAFIGALLALALTITQTWYAVNSPPRP
ncbi:UPF0481 protein At3g47200-like [Quercus lobata]|uniref:UPF0481 protein At3g47200-like n=1 Tax=Quercus lobata TaxID=97700 RepID=UPI001248D123|nr:UPF0481 protein At3g47200-like [Quercus lobata]